MTDTATMTAAERGRRRGMLRAFVRARLVNALVDSGVPRGQARARAATIADDVIDAHLHSRGVRDTGRPWVDFIRSIMPAVIAVVKILLALLGVPLPFSAQGAAAGQAANAEAWDAALDLEPGPIAVAAVPGPIEQADAAVQAARAGLDGATFDLQAADTAVDAAADALQNAVGVQAEKAAARDAQAASYAQAISDLINTIHAVYPQ